MGDIRRELLETKGLLLAEKMKSAELSALLAELVDEIIRIKRKDKCTCTDTVICSKCMAAETLDRYSDKLGRILGIEEADKAARS